jgi:hypothetical protein
MSETQEHVGRKARREAAHTDEVTATNTAEAMIQAGATSGNGQYQSEDTDTEGNVDDMGNVQCKIKTKSGTEVSYTLPHRVKAGDTFTENQALIYDSHCARQLANNLSANASAKEKRLAKALADNDQASILANQPYTVAEVLEMWLKPYEPEIGGGPRISTIEKTRREAAWSAWAYEVAEHDRLVASGKPGLFKACVDVNGKPIAVPDKFSMLETPRQPRNATPEQVKAHKAVVEALTERREAHISRMLEMSTWAERIQVQLDRILTERGSKKAAEPTAETAAPAITVGSLLD